MRDSFGFQTEPYLDYSEIDPRQYDVIPPLDTRRCVSDTTVAPFRYVCSVEGALGTGVTAFGSGTLIGPRTVLTAGHNVANLLPANTRVVPGRNGRSEPNGPLGSARAAAFQLAPGFVGSTATDYAVIILGDPIGNRVGWWTFDHFRFPGDIVGTSVIRGGLPISATGVRVSIAGYPGDLPAPTHLGGRADPCFRPGVNVRARVQYIDNNKARRVTPSGLLEYDNDTFRGNSGSPVWHELDRSQGRVLIAVHISGDTAEFPDILNRGVFIQGTVLDFVRAHSFYPPGAAPPGAAGRPNVRYGSNGTAVKELQYRLNIWIAVTPGAGMPRLIIDGKFGSKTLSAVRAFQRAMVLTVDGVVGPQTWGRLIVPF
jgi:V8-like Glu-specific endopeptidase